MMKIITLLALFAYFILMTATASPIDKMGSNSSTKISNDHFYLNPPKKEAPTIIHAHFEVYSLDDINDEKETFELTGILTLKWMDPRRAFNPAILGITEKVFQGHYQFHELSTGWYPEVILVNRSDLYEKEGVVFRIQADGTVILTETLNLAARTDFNMKRFPFDTQRLEAVFEVLGFDKHEVIMKVVADTGNSLTSNVNVPQWSITGTKESVRDRSVSYNGKEKISSEFVVSIDVQRESLHMKRLVIIPLIVIVLLSFTVFWMDRSSIGDRLGVSFIGVLTGVSYQILISDQMPSISYFTFMNGFLTLSFLATCATVIITLRVNSLDNQGKVRHADRIDRHSRWAFPLGYFILIFLLAWAIMI